MTDTQNKQNTQNTENVQETEIKALPLTKEQVDQFFEDLKIDPDGIFYGEQNIKDKIMSHTALWFVEDFMYRSVKDLNAKPSRVTVKFIHPDRPKKEISIVLDRYVFEDIVAIENGKSVIAKRNCISKLLDSIGLTAVKVDASKLDDPEYMKEITDSVFEECKKAKEALNKKMQAYEEEKKANEDLRDDEKSETCTDIEKDIADGNFDQDTENLADAVIGD